MDTKRGSTLFFIGIHIFFLKGKFMSGSMRLNSTSFLFSSERAIAQGSLCTALQRYIYTARIRVYVASLSRSMRASMGAGGARLQVIYNITFDRTRIKTYAPCTATIKHGPFLPVLPRHSIMAKPIFFSKLDHMHEREKKGARARRVGWSIVSSSTGPP